MSTNTNLDDVGSPNVKNLVKNFESRRKSACDISSPTITKSPSHLVPRSKSVPIAPSIKMNDLVQAGDIHDDAIKTNNRFNNKIVSRFPTLENASFPVSVEKKMDDAMTDILPKSKIGVCLDKSIEITQYRSSSIETDICDSAEVSSSKASTQMHGDVNENRKRVIIGLQSHIKSNRLLSPNRVKVVEKQKSILPSNAVATTQEPPILSVGHLRTNQQDGETTTENGFNNDEQYNDPSLENSNQVTPIHSIDDTDPSTSNDFKEISVCDLFTPVISTPPPCGNESSVQEEAEEGNHLSNIIKYCQSAALRLTPMKRSKTIPKDSFDISSDSNLDTANISHKRIRTPSIRSNRILLKLCNLKTHATAIIRKNWVIFRSKLKLNKDVIVETITKSNEWVQRFGKMLLIPMVSLETSFLIPSISNLLPMIAAIYPTVPKCNCALSTLALLFHLSPAHNEKSIGIAITFSLLSILSIIFDVDWLMSDTLRVPIDDDYADFAYEIYDARSLSRSVSWYATLLNIFFKLGTLYSIINNSNEGIRLQKIIWSKIHTLCPPTSFTIPANVHENIQSRVIAIWWIEFVCSMMISLLGLFVLFEFPYSPFFSVPLPLVSLRTLMFGKGISGFITALGILPNSTLLDILRPMFCMKSCDQYYFKRKQYLLRKRGYDAPKVDITSSFLRFNGFLKFLDLIMGILMWVSLSSAHGLEGWGKPKMVKIILILLTLLLLITDILCVLLWFVIWCYFKLLDHDHTLQQFDLQSTGLSSPMRKQSNSSKTDEFYSKNIMQSGYHYQDLEDFSGISLSTLDKETLSLPKFGPFSASVLDQSVVISHEEFVAMWKQLPTVKYLRFRSKRPHLNRAELSAYFNKSHFYTIASGDFKSGEGGKLYLVGQIKEQKCLCEIIFNNTNGIVALTMKCNNKDLVELFQTNLNISYL